MRQSNIQPFPLRLTIGSAYFSEAGDFVLIRVASLSKDEMLYHSFDGTYHSDGTSVSGNPDDNLVLAA